MKYTVASTLQRFHSLLSYESASFLTFVSGKRLFASLFLPVRLNERSAANLVELAGERGSTASCSQNGIQGPS